MADYAIGDVQGCYEALERLLNEINFSSSDKLWFVGDLVNRGPQSLEVLRFIYNLKQAVTITLGNHDLHFLVALFCPKMARHNKDDTLKELLEADDRYELGHWLRKQSFIKYEPSLNIVVCHAGIAPVWDLNLALSLAKEVEKALSGEDFLSYLEQLYGNEPHHWKASLKGMDRLRLITNYFTRMRFCNSKGDLLLNFKGSDKEAPSEHIPWYLVPNRKEIKEDIVFGHWAALQGKRHSTKLYPIDTGCFWGGKLTALRLQDRKFFSVDATTI